jgi:hypothetical protein
MAELNYLRVDLMIEYCEEFGFSKKCLYVMIGEENGNS